MAEINSFTKTKAKETTCNEQNLPNISTAWLVLSHGPWVGAAIALMAITVAVYVAFISGFPNLRPLGVGLSVASLCVSLWTAYAVYVTGRVSMRFQYPIFGLGGVISLMAVVLIVAAVNLWTMVDLLNA